MDKSYRFVIVFLWKSVMIRKLFQNKRIIEYYEIIKRGHTWD